jgi:hypothetical protein
MYKFPNSHQQYTRVSISPYLHQCLLCLVFLIITCFKMKGILGNLIFSETSKCWSLSLVFFKLNFT